MLGILFLAMVKILDIVLTFMLWMVLLRAVLSWFTIEYKATPMRLLIAITEPLLMRIRRFLPPSTLDFSPLVAVLVLYFADVFLVRNLYGLGERLR